MKPMRWCHRSANPNHKLCSNGRLTHGLCGNFWHSTRLSHDYFANSQWIGRQAKSQWDWISLPSIHIGNVRLNDANYVILRVCKPIDLDICIAIIKRKKPLQWDLLYGIDWKSSIIRSGNCTCPGKRDSRFKIRDWIDVLGACWWWTLAFVDWHISSLCSSPSDAHV